MHRFKLNKYRLMAYLYFFFNNVGLPGGLLCTNLLTPFLYIWLLYKKKQPVLLPLLVVLIPFDIIHIIGGVEWIAFITSNFLFISTYIFVQCFVYFVNHYAQIEDIYKRLLMANFVFTLLACVVYFTPFKELLWYKNKFTHSVNDFYRLALLTFEASYYSLLMVPLAMYYLLKVFFRQNTQPAYGTLLMVGLPLLLSLSLGVLGGMAISFVAIYLLHWEKVFYRKSFFSVMVFCIVSVVGMVVFLYLFFPNNPIFVRINNIYYGIDTSTRGRTTDSFSIAWLVAKEKSVWFGAGLGQIKVLAYDIVKKYFSYWGELEVVRIPNTVAETLAYFGICGLMVRFGLIFYFFFKAKVLNNYYQTALFVFVFVYQFTGSYITNIVEYAIWVLAFSNTFPRFNVYSHSPTTAGEG